MLLNPVRLKLTQNTTNTATVTGGRLFLGQAVDSELLEQVYAEQIADTTPNEAKALYTASFSSQRLPSVHDILLRHLRG